MGAAKREMERQEHLEYVAVEIAVRVGLLRRCGICSDVTDPGKKNFVDAYKLANYLFTKKDPLVEDVRNRGELTDILKEITDGVSSECSCLGIPPDY